MDDVSVSSCKKTRSPVSVFWNQTQVEGKRQNTPGRARAVHHRLPLAAAEPALLLVASVHKHEVHKWYYY